MAISIDWGTKVISVPVSYLTQVQVSPVPIYNLPLNLFRLDLKALEASPEGMPFVRTHNHNTEVLLGGIVYARIIEIINGYTVTFEDGQYAVNLIGANSNVGDVVNVNQVSVRSQNSAGLISNQAIEFASFNGGVTFDQYNISGRASSGTVFPIGTPQVPVNNLSDLHLISDRRGLPKIYVLGNADVDDTASWISHEWQGESPLKSNINIQSAAQVLNCEFYDCSLSGTLDGNSQIEKSVISGIDFVDGYVFQCSLGPSVIQLGSSTIANFFSCYSTIPGNTTPIIDMNTTGILALRDYNGGIRLQNYSSNGSHSIDLSSGQVILDSTTITSGTFVIRGVGKLIDENGQHISSGTWNTNVTIVNELVNVPNITDGVWNADESDFITSGTYGVLMKKIQQLTEEIHRLHGLETGTPLVVTKTSRTAGDIEQTIVADDNESTVNRTP